MFSRFVADRMRRSVTRSRIVILSALRSWTETRRAEPSLMRLRRPLALVHANWQRPGEHRERRPSRINVSPTTGFAGETLITAFGRLAADAGAAPSTRSAALASARPPVILALRGLRPSRVSIASIRRTCQPERLLRRAIGRSYSAAAAPTYPSEQEGRVGKETALPTG
jgi:hypothetical protein